MCALACVAKHAPGFGWQGWRQKQRFTALGMWIGYEPLAGSAVETRDGLLNCAT